MSKETRRDYENNDPNSGTIAELRKGDIKLRQQIRNQAQMDGADGHPSINSHHVLNIEKDIDNQYLNERNIALSVVIQDIKNYEDERNEVSQNIETSDYHKLSEPLLITNNARIDDLSEEQRKKEKKIDEFLDNLKIAYAKADRDTKNTDGQAELLLNSPKYWILINAIGGVESLNTFFALLGQLGYIAALVIALVCGGFTILVVHFAGIALKRKLYSRFAILLSIGLLLAIGPAGYRNIDHKMNNNDTEFVMGDYDGDIQIDEQEESDKQLRDFAFLIILIGIGLASLAIGILLAYRKSDSNANVQDRYVECHTNVPQLERDIKNLRLDKIQIADEHNREISRIMKEHYDNNPELKGQVAKYEQIIKDHNVLCTHYNTVSDIAEKMAESAIEMYRSENRSKRKGIPAPAIWNKEPKVTFDRMTLLSNGILSQFRIILK